MKYQLRYSPESEREFRELRAYVRRVSGSARVASKYLKRLRTFCEELSIAPHRGEAPFQSKTGLRRIGFERDISVLFRIKPEDQIVEILGIFDHGRDVSQAHERDF